MANQQGCSTARLINHRLGFVLITIASSSTRCPDGCPCPLAKATWPWRFSAPAMQGCLDRRVPWHPSTTDSIVRPPIPSTSGISGFRRYPQSGSPCTPAARVTNLTSSHSSLGYDCFGHTPLQASPKHKHVQLNASLRTSMPLSCPSRASSKYTGCRSLSFPPEPSASVDTTQPASRFPTSP